MFINHPYFVDEMAVDTLFDGDNMVKRWDSRHDYHTKLHAMMGARNQNISTKQNDTARYGRFKRYRIQNDRWHRAISPWSSAVRGSLRPGVTASWEFSGTFSWPQFLEKLSKEI
jgi:hypothetical protein